MYLVPSAKDSQLKIFHEDSLHTDNIYDYIWNNQTNDKTMQQFTLQFYIKVGTKVISTKIIDYMAKTKNYGKVDHLHSEKIACIGFFHYFHPEHHHRERLRQHCVEHIKKIVILMSNLQYFHVKFRQAKVLQKQQQGR